jgi:hypothetical protein
VSEKLAETAKPDVATVPEVLTLFNEVKRLQRAYLKAREQCAACKKAQQDALTAEAKAQDLWLQAKRKLDALVDAE